MDKWKKLRVNHFKKSVRRLKKKWEVRVKFHPILMVVYSVLIMFSLIIGKVIFPSDCMLGFALIYILLLMSYSFVVGLLDLAKRREEFETIPEILIGVGQSIFALTVLTGIIFLLAKVLAIIFQTSTGNVIFVIAVLKVLVPEIKLVNLEKERKLQMLEILKGE